MRPTPFRALVWPALAIVGIIGTILLGFLSYTQHQKIVALQVDRNIFLLEVASSTKTLNDEMSKASSTIADLTTTVGKLLADKEELQDELGDEKNRNEEFEDQIKKIAGTVGDLDKLSKTDEELLQKYSKVYFLNENYIPSRLKKIDNSYVLAGRSEQYFHAEALPFLVDMIDDAADDGIDLKVVSAYRSFDQQATLKGAYTQMYGSGANAFSADQGYSEHQLGTTLDITDPATAGTYTSFENTEAFAWLQKNAYKYGFIISYPKGNAYYVYEPWHWRFVGEELAGDLHDDEANFYDWDQRKINEYLIKIFD